jgi:hypothetical protein
VGETTGQRDLYYFSTICAGIIEYRFESWVRRDKLTVLGPGECFGAEFENLSRTVPEQDFLAIDIV